MTESIIFTVLQDVIWLVLLIGGGYLFGRAFYKIYKGERRLAKMPNIPEHCLPVNEDLSSYDFHKDIQPRLDYSYYIMRTADLLDIPWQQLVGKQVFDNHNFDFRLE